MDQTPINENMKYQTKSIIIGRKPRTKNGDLNRPCFISLFDSNDPHKTCQEPKQILDFENIHKIMIKKLKINYLLLGNHIVINNLKEINIEKKGEHLLIKGKQKLSSEF